MTRHACHPGPAGGARGADPSGGERQLTDERKERAQLQCGVDLLEALAGDEALATDGLAVSRLAALTGRDRALVTRIAADLVDLGLVDRSPATRRLKLGWGLHTLVTGISNERLRRRSHTLLRELADATGETAYTVIRIGTDAVSVAEAVPAQAVAVVSWVGRSWPVARSDAGPTLLSAFTHDGIRALLGGRLPETEAARAPTEMEGLLALVDEAAANGVSLLDEQADVEIASAAAPVYDHQSRLVASVVVTGPSARVRPRLAEFGEHVVGTAARLSRDLGAPQDVQ